MTFLALDHVSSRTGCTRAKQKYSHCTRVEANYARPLPPPSDPTQDSPLAQAQNDVRIS